jgi:hypothetical protein
MSKKKKKRIPRGQEGWVNPLKGTKVDKESRGPDAPKLGRPHTVSESTERVNVNLTLPDGTMDKLKSKFNSVNKSQLIREAILKSLE